MRPKRAGHLLNDRIAGHAIKGAMKIGVGANQDRDWGGAAKRRSGTELRFKTVHPGRIGRSGRTKLGGETGGETIYHLTDLIQLHDPERVERHDAQAFATGFFHQTLALEQMQGVTDRLREIPRVSASSACRMRWPGEKVRSAIASSSCW